MVLPSSPIVYPPSSSPAEAKESRKRPNTEVEQNTRPSKLKKRLFGNDIFAEPAAEVLSVESGKTRDEAENSETPNLGLEQLNSEKESFAWPQNLDNPTESDSQNTTEGTDDTQWSYISTTSKRTVSIKTCSGKTFKAAEKEREKLASYQEMVARRSKQREGKPTTSYFGVDIHKLLDEAKELVAEKEAARKIEEYEAENVPAVVESVEENLSKKKRRSKHSLWTEKYRAKRFTDLVGDERTHRHVLRWLKAWDPIVFPGSSKPVLKPKRNFNSHNEEDEQRSHRKILLLTGPPGLGKTTLAHVCARQAGYEVLEINASDERSKDVVRGRIRDSVGTETVRGINTKTGEGEATVRKQGRPVCVVVDEVDGVVGGNSGAGGDGGFMKALIDLVQLDQKNSAPGSSTAKGKGDRFRMLRPMILICNDVYYPALRPLRSSSIAEIIHVRKPPLDKVVTRMKDVFEREGIAADNDGVRRLCEAAWGVSARREERARATGDAAEGDVRGVLVVGEWAAGKLRATCSSKGALKLTKQWVEKNLTSDLATGGSGSRGIGRGSAREAAERVFLENAGFPKAATAAAANAAASKSLLSDPAPDGKPTDNSRRAAISLLRNVIDSSGDADRIVTDLFTSYPTQPFQDDTYLSKPCAALDDWLFFHDQCSSRVFTGQEWELHPYLSTSSLAFHYLFASPAATTALSSSRNPRNQADEELEAPFTGPRAARAAHEAQRATSAQLTALHAGLALPLARTLGSDPARLATDLVPYLARLLAPQLAPVVVAGTASVRKDTEKAMLRRAAAAACDAGVGFERVRVEEEQQHAGSVLGNRSGGWAFRMEPAVDVLAGFETAEAGIGKARYAVRQVLESEIRRVKAERAAEARAARSGVAVTGGAAAAGKGEEVDKENEVPGGGEAKKAPALAKPRRDFFGRILPPLSEKANVQNMGSRVLGAAGLKSGGGIGGVGGGNKTRIWVTYHEGFSNAVKKPISVQELLGRL